MTLSRRNFMLASGATLLGASSLQATTLYLDRLNKNAKFAKDRPNVIFILCDDLGFGDVGRIFQNKRDAIAKLKTPQIDAMSEAGCLLTDHYTAAPVCAPARASLMTGKHQGHCTLRDNQFDRPIENEFTLGTLMQSAGYVTYAIGKWGMGGGGESHLPVTGAPWESGFNHSYCYMAHRDGHTYYHNATYKPVFEDGKIAPDAEVALRYDTDLFTARAEKFIDDHQKQHADEPFFLYLAYTTIHGSYAEPGAKLDCNLMFHVPGRAFKPVMGAWPLEAEAKAKANTWIHPEHNAAHGFTTPAMRRYATSLRRLDDNLGDLMAFLKAKGLSDQTMIVFTSDNGPAKEQGGDPALFTSAGPFRGYKRWVTEGGIREPTFALWPGHIPAGRVCNEPSQFQCWMPTLATVAGLPPPAHSDGVSILPHLTGKGKAPIVPIYGEYRSSGFGFEHQQFMRVGDLSIFRQRIQNADTPIEVYDVKKDPFEEKNLASELPAERVKQMRDELLRHRMPVRQLMASVGVAGFQDAPRPYDDAAIPGLANCNVKEQTIYFDKIDNCVYMPDLRCLKPAKAPAADGLVMQKGVLQYATEQAITVTCTHPKAFYLWVHNCRVFSYEEAGEHKIILKLGAGAHPYRAYWQRENGKDAKFAFKA